MQRNDVASTSFRRHVPTRFLINQCQIITFFNLKSDNIENSRKLKGIVLQVPSNQIKVTFIIILPFNLLHLWFFPVSHRNVGGLFGGGVAKGMLPPPSPPISHYWGVWPPCPPPLPTPMVLSYYMYIFALIKLVLNRQIVRFCFTILPGVLNGRLCYVW